MSMTNKNLTPNDFHKSNLRRKMDKLNLDEPVPARSRFFLWTHKNRFRLKSRRSRTQQGILARLFLLPYSQDPRRRECPSCRSFFRLEIKKPKINFTVIEGDGSRKLNRTPLVSNFLCIHHQSSSVANHNIVKSPYICMYIKKIYFNYQFVLSKLN